MKSKSFRLGFLIGVAFGIGVVHADAKIAVCEAVSRVGRVLFR